MHRGPSARKSAGNTTAAGVLSTAGVVGLVVLGYRGQEFDLQQTAYASREDCLKDWGSEESCPQISSPGSGQQTYYGPRYYWDPGRGRPVIVRPDGSERVADGTRVGPSGSRTGSTRFAGSFARGGFGGVGRGFGSGHA
jgi:hypothetical protein